MCLAQSKDWLEDRDKARQEICEAKKNMSDASYFMDMNILSTPIFATHKRYGTWSGTPELYKEYSFHMRNIESWYYNNVGAYDAFLKHHYPDEMPELYQTT